MIVTCCPSRIHNGVWRHLKELEQFGTYHYDVNDSIPNDAKFIIFGGAWNGNYASINTEMKNHGAKSGLLFCSPYGQANLSNEIPHLVKGYELLMNGTIDYLFTGTQEMANLFKHPRIIFLPQTLDYEKFLEEHDCVVEPETGAVGLFCSRAPHKNVLNQVMSLKGTGQHLFTNALNEDMINMALLSSVRYTNFEWLDDKTYYGLLKRIPIHLQCSYSEAFDYVVAETMLLGNPVLVGPTIDWVWEELIIRDIDNPLEIKSAINNLLASPINKEMLRIKVVQELDRRASIAKEVLSKL